MTTQPSTLHEDLTRPSNATAYAQGDHVCNSTSALEAEYLQFAIPAGIRAFDARKLVAHKSNTTNTNATFRLHMLAAAPTDPVADNDVLTALRLDNPVHYLGYFEFTFAATLGDFAFVEAAPAAGGQMTLVPDDNTSWADSARYVYGVFEARAGYTPASGETFDFTIHGYATDDEIGG